MSALSIDGLAIVNDRDFLRAGIAALLGRSRKRRVGGLGQSEADAIEVNESQRLDNPLLASPAAIAAKHRSCRTALNITFWQSLSA